jgi:hypothetical protein
MKAYQRRHKTNLEESECFCEKQGEDRRSKMKKLKKM